ncbi:MAG: membrane-bound O-acyltransferase family protein [Chloroflexi bacterium]|nr:membrane-bound O-acyltransferase family protein [Chloroflexota bacterium]
MIFQSYEYISLLIFVLVIFWFLSRKIQNIILLIASYIFYGYITPWLVFLLLSYTLVNYFSALKIQNTKSQKNRKLFFAFSIFSGLFVLGAFKYFGFFIENFTDLLAYFGFLDSKMTLQIFLPVGISFYTFQTISYVFDVYKGKTKARKSIIDVSLFIGFFPQLIAGPIERANSLLTQIEKQKHFKIKNFNDGIFLIIWGFFKKLVIADNVAIISDKIFLLQDPHFSLLVLASLAFGVQIFADFSGYTDIARGSAKLFGINLSNNFNNPYFSRSMIEFWRRWHITLSIWFRDYVYIPLGGSKRSNAKTYLNILITFILTGLWHGAAWNFVFWGLYNGIIIILTRIYLSKTNFRINALGIMLTFCFIHIGWFIFRSENFYLSLLSSFSGISIDFKNFIYLFMQVLIFSLPLYIFGAYQVIITKKNNLHRLGFFDNLYIKSIIVMFLYLGILILRSNSTSDFIYFKF